MSELLPRPVRLLLGATSPGIGDSRLRDGVRGKVVLVTGASSGIGEATARRLGGAGATVLLVARSVDRLQAIADEITGGGGSAFVHPCDLSEPERVADMVVEVLDQHGHVDVVVNNAGLSLRRWISESYDRFRDFERTINLNYLGPVRLMLELLPSMRERGEGHIVNVSTVGVDFPAMRWSAYIASKAAFETWLGGAAPEILVDGVTVSSIHMQLVRSPMLGPFRMWRYVPGMSTEEAAGIVARATVERPRRISPWFARIGGPITDLAQPSVERRLSRQARAAFAPGPTPPGPTATITRAISRSAKLGNEAVGGLTTIAATRLVRPVRPDRMARVLLAQRRYGASPAFIAAAAAELHGDRRAVIDELGALTFSELDERIRALASSLHRHIDLRGGQRVAIMCRNHRGFVYAAAAASRLGCDLVPLNTEFAGPQLADVLARERVIAAVYDQEFESVFDAAEFAGARIVAWHEEPIERPTLDALISVAEGDAPHPRSPGRTVMLTSGTTGTPKGAHRTIPARAVLPLALMGLFDASKLKPTPRSGEPFVVPPPLYHLYGQIGLAAAFGMGSSMIIRRRFDSEATLESIDRERAAVLLAVPTMLKRIMDLPSQTRRRYDTSSLRVVISGAAPLPPQLALAVMDEFGDVLYNGYASTEVGMGTLATPHDLRRAPGTVGRPPLGVTIKILDEEGLQVRPGQTGRIFVGSPLLFEGYSGGGGKEMIDGLMSTGDVGHLDDGGRLFIDGRDDDMIVSGGENVFPQEVEELLTAHEAVADAAVYGVPDEDFGQRLAAYVVRKPKAKVSPEELKAYIRERLARYKVPREIEFVNQLPRTSTGKLQRRRLAELAQNLNTGHG